MNRQMDGKITDGCSVQSVGDLLHWGRGHLIGGTDVGHVHLQSLDWTGLVDSTDFWPPPRFGLMGLVDGKRDFS